MQLCKMSVSFLVYQILTEKESESRMSPKMNEKRSSTPSSLKINFTSPTPSGSLEPTTTPHSPVTTTSTTQPSLLFKPCYWRRVFARATHLRANWRRGRYVSYAIAARRQSAGGGAPYSCVSQRSGAVATALGASGVRVWDLRSSTIRYEISGKNDDTREKERQRIQRQTVHYGTKPGHFETSIIHFPNEGVRCERTSEGTSEWPSTCVSILVCSRP